MIVRNTHNPLNLWDTIDVDLFAGGGGASIGVEHAIGRSVAVAVNHDRNAVAMHRMNHPHTRHLCQDVYDVDPIEATGGRPVARLWVSPDCTHHSKARGGKPIRNKRSRELAWVVPKWAAAVRPQVIYLENVEEFANWGPLTRKRGRKKHPRACPFRKSLTFNRFVSQLEALGYAVEWRELRACDYGVPTIRKRLFLVARCDGLPIRWPQATHGEARRSPKPHRQARACTHGAASRSQGILPGSDAGDPAADRSCHQKAIHSEGRRLLPFRTAAECIDFDHPCPSIFTRKRPLAHNTEKRIVAGLVRYVIEAGEPFIVATNHGNSGGRRTYPMDEPMRTVCASSRGGEALISPTLIQSGYGERKGQAPRVPGLHKPLGTVVGTTKHAVVSAFMARHFGGMTARDLDQPLPTTTTRGTQNQLVAAHMTHLYGTNQGGGGDLNEPARTVTSSGNHAGLVAAMLAPYYGSGSGETGRDPRQPLPTVTTKERLSLIHAALEHAPEDYCELPAGFYRVWKLLIDHLGEDAPVPIVVLNSHVYLIVDIGMRMLQPRELYNAQGFPRDYIIDRGVDEQGGRIKLTKTDQVKFCGNSVCPGVVKALVSANVPACEREAELEEVCA